MTRFALTVMLNLLLPLASAAEDLPGHRDLTVAAVAMEDGLDPSEHAGDWLRLYMPELRAELEAGEMDEAEARRRALEDLRERAEDFTPDEPLTIETKVYVYPYDPESETFPLGPMFHEYYFAAPSQDAESLPRSYRVLVANMDLLEALPMEPERAANWRERRQRLHGSIRRLVYATAQLRLVEFQNGRDFQAVLTRVDLYDDPERKERLHRFEESRSPEKVVNDRLLSEGVTWEAIENHGFEYLGIRLLAVLPEHHPELDECEKDGRVMGHAVIRCTMSATISRIPVNMERFYVGGRLARVIIHRAGPPGADHSRTVGHSLRRAGLPGQPPTGEPVTWEYREASVRYDPTVLAPGAESDCTAFLEVNAVPYLELANQEKRAGETGEEGV